MRDTACPPKPKSLSLILDNGSGETEEKWVLCKDRAGINHNVGKKVMMGTPQNTLLLYWNTLLV